MHLKSFCIILPAEFDEPELVHHKKVEKLSGKESSSWGCSTPAFDFFRRYLQRFFGLKCVSFCHQEVPKKQFSGVFFDAEGVQIQEKVGGENPRIFSYSELYIGSNGFNEREVLGSGGFGRVYRAVLPSDGTVVAVKCLAERGESFEKTFMAELVAVAHLRHRNLVRLRGWCIHNEELLLVYDYMPNRSLDRATLAWARWLEHDLQYKPKTPPVLKNRRFRLEETTRIGGTIGYLPPESFQKRSVATAKSDVFSFGIVVLEVVSGRRAVDLTYPDDQIILLDWIRRLSDEGALLQAGDTRLQDGSYKLSEMERLIRLGLMCTFHDPQSRPNMKWVMEVLSGNVYGKLPDLPSFQSHPLYISLSSATNTSTSNTAATKSSRTTSASTTAFHSSDFVSANAETIYVSAESDTSSIIPASNRCQPKKTFPVVETPRVITYEEIISATNNFSDSHRVAEVDFGTAYHGFLENRYHVIVKRLGMKTCPALRMRFANEFQNLGRLRHRNLVQLRGWCTEQGRCSLFMITQQIAFSATFSSIMNIKTGNQSCTGTTDTT
ncbi:UNVERIFIED_CONTAM: Receptor like protein kinase S.2 [Sesamum angustifolium]|uniref:Receptor like protein kinase S.2 n=1 Tax=Sesamum angustifolium TaxID=2727405 RepID=A0AAW2P174_9LAMI